MTRPQALSLSRGRHKVELRHRKILRALAWAYPRPMTTGDLIAVLWDDRDEPDSATNVLRIAIHDLRKAGWAITAQNRVGYRLSAEAFDKLTLPINHTQGRAR